MFPLFHLIFFFLDFFGCHVQRLLMKRFFIADVKMPDYRTFEWWEKEYDVPEPKMARPHHIQS